MAACGDVATQEALGGHRDPARAPSRSQGAFRERRGPVQDAARAEHPHGSTDREFDSLFTVDKPVIFNFHGYPWLIHKLAYRFSHDEPARARLQGEGQHATRI
jgi:xylulose-5-phosphate/fructose-6-phosphate phosphoketolase